MATAQLQASKRSRQDRQPEILAAARELLERRGLEGFSIADVASRVEMSEAAVFYHFPTRRELMFRVISDWMLPVIERLELDLRHIKSTRERLLAFSTRHLREMAVSPGLYRLIYRELHCDRYYTSSLHHLVQRYGRIVLWIVEQGGASGEIRGSADALLTRDLLFGGLHHVGLRTLLNSRELDTERVGEQIADQLYASIRATAEGSVPASPSALEKSIQRLERVADRIERKA